MHDKNLLRRIECIENELGEETPPGELSPALQESVDRLLGRLKPTIAQGENKDEPSK